MTTATAPQTAAEQLSKLDETRDKLHLATREARAKVDAYDAETEQLRADYTHHRHTHPEEFYGGDFRPKPDSEAAKLARVIRERTEGPNPLQPAYEDARGTFHEVDAACQEFRRKRLTDLLADAYPDLAQDSEEFRDAWATIARISQRYEAKVGAARQLIVDTPGLNGQYLTIDPRPHEWARAAREALEGSEIAAPGLTELGAWKLEQR